MPSLRSLRFRLILMFGAVVATAMGVLFLYVVPSLRDDLVNDRLDRLERVAQLQQQATGLKRAMASGKHLRRPLVRTQRLANATVTGYRLVDGELEPLELAPPLLLRGRPGCQGGAPLGGRPRPDAERRRGGRVHGVGRPALPHVAA